MEESGGLTLSQCGVKMNMIVFTNRLYKVEVLS